MYVYIYIYMGIYIGGDQGDSVVTKRQGALSVIPVWYVTA